MKKSKADDEDEWACGPSNKKTVQLKNKVLFEFKFNLSRWHSYKSEKALLDAEDAETPSSSWGDINSLGKWSAWYFIIADVGPS